MFLRQLGLLYVHLQFVDFSQNRLHSTEAKVSCNVDLRSQFACDVALYEPEMLVFLDETSCDRKNSL